MALSCAFLHSAFFLLPSPPCGLGWAYLEIANSRWQMANWASIRQLTAPSHETYVQGSRFKVRSMLIRLVPNGGFSVRQRRAAPGVVKRVIGRRLRHRSDAEQAPEGVEREEPPVEAERKLSGTPEGAEARRRGERHSARPSGCRRRGG